MMTGVDIVAQAVEPNRRSESGGSMSGSESMIDQLVGVFIVWLGWLGFARSVLYISVSVDSGGGLGSVESPSRRSGYG